MIIEYPTKDGIKYFTDGTIYLVADNASVNQYCTEKGYTLNDYTKEDQRFSNDGALTYAYWDNGEWKIEFGFKKIVNELDVD